MIIFDLIYYLIIYLSVIVLMFFLAKYAIKNKIKKIYKIILLVIALIFILYSGIMISNIITDLQCSFTKRYLTYKGEVNNFYKDYANAKNAIGFKLVVVLSGEYFKTAIDNEKYLQKGKKYSVKYLPYTRYIVEINEIK